MIVMFAALLAHKERTWRFRLDGPRRLREAVALRSLVGVGKSHGRPRALPRFFGLVILGKLSSKASMSLTKSSASWLGSAASGGGRTIGFLLGRFVGDPGGVCSALGGPARASGGAGLQAGLPGLEASLSASSTLEASEKSRRASSGPA